MSDPSMLPSLGCVGSNLSPACSQLLLGLGAPAIMLSQLSSLLRSDPLAGMLPGPPQAAERLYLISDDHLPMRRALNAGTALLSRTYHEGAFHRAHEVMWSTPTALQTTEWIALIPHECAQTPDGALSAAALSQAKTEHRHNQQVTACAPDLLPGYAGMAVVVGARVQDGSLPPRTRIAHLWRRKDATLDDLVRQGGLVAGARLGPHRLTLTDLRLILVRLGRLYQRLHELGMVYTDPKPANIALDLSIPVQDRSTGLISRLGRGMSLALQESLRSLAGAGRSWHPSPIGRLCFIDAESLQLPGYAQDDGRPAVTAMTPSWTSPQVLSALGTQSELKRMQSSAASDAFHLAAIGFALITGQAPQERLADERSLDPALREEFATATSTARFAQASLEVRVQRDFATEQRRLAFLVDSQLIPAALARLILEGLTGGVQDLRQWTTRLLGDDWDATPR